MKENKSLELKGNGGITLIALVITIIVLIILAGISIAMISGQNGILTNASKAAVENAIGAAKDQCALIATQEVHDYYDELYVQNKASAKAIDTRIIDKLNNNSDVVKALGTGSSCTVTGSSITLKYSDGSTCSGEISDGVITWNAISFAG